MRGVGGARFKNEDPYSGIKYPDAGYRLLSLYRYWNYIAYYFPYKYLMDDNWNDILKEYIPIFSTASSELEYKLAVLSLIARIDDSHASIRSSEEPTSELQSLMRISYAVFCCKKKNTHKQRLINL